MTHDFYEAKCGSKRLRWSEIEIGGVLGDFKGKDSRFDVATLGKIKVNLCISHQNSSQSWLIAK